MKYPESESVRLELKETFPRNDQVIKTVIGFCNQHGGKLAIGVKDDRTIVGLESSVVEHALDSLDAAIFNACSPPIIPRIYAQVMDGKTILVVEVSEGMNKPYYRKSEGIEKGTYLRVGRSTVRADDSTIQELTWKSHGLEFEAFPLYRATEDDLSLARIEAFLQKRKNRGGAKVSLDVLKSYGLVVEEQGQTYPTNGGMLLFGNRPQQFMSEAMMICSHFRGTSGREAIATVDCEGDLFDQYYQALDFILSRLYRSFSIKGLEREEQLEIPEEAIREALLNAIVHRNYHLKGPTKVAIYEDRLEIFSPGQCLIPINNHNLLLGRSQLRNPSICKVFREAGHIEKLGTGFITIFESYKKRELAEPTVVDGPGFVKVILPRSSMAIPEKEEYSEVLKLIDTYEEVSVKDVIQRLSISRATASRRLTELVENGTIQRLGHGRSVRYRRA